MIFDDIFKHKTPIYEKLLDFGFIFKNDQYMYHKKIVDNQFELHVSVFPDGKIQKKVFDLDTGEEYRLHLIEGVSGEFVGKVRTDCLEILHSISNQCFKTKIFKTEYANKIINYAKEKYHSDLEYLWENFPEYAVLRRKDNQKWYAVLMIVEKNKLGLSGNEKIEIIDLREEPQEIMNLVDRKRFFGGYHMNKKSWITLVLDGSIDLQDIYDHINVSYLLAGKKK